MYFFYIFQCNTAIGTKNFFDTINKLPRKVMLFGAACTHVTVPIARTAKHWHITQVRIFFVSLKIPNNLIKVNY